MIKRLIGWAVVMSGAASLCLCAAESPQAAGDRLDIQVIHLQEWNAGQSDILSVLRSAAGELVRYFPGRTLAPLEVENKGGPIVLFQRGPKGEYRIKLDTGGTLWAQYAYQFSHELCHVLCNYKEEVHFNKWFEESLCELASLFALRGMSKSWQTQPPYPNWKEYSKALASYAQDRMAKAALPKGVTLADWYEENKGPLNANATGRERNTVVATALLPLFEQKPEQWEAVTWLNTETLTPAHTFKAYLEAWQRQCPEKHKAFVAEIARQFNLQLGH